ncbi:ribonuclease E [Prauserella marina]|uniref:Ribonuclease E n=1 Tax=Prauserella marina TaxID=530584 RepID=A0A222VMB4_9PSEU|nr:ribonuclease E/G [Prauserella marina]ASR35069.1 ribonuclease E [Prauserella marina]PWV85185.1 ribonuclease E [Prauserella marina]SDC02842.1 ribonuclease E [Prauserella marina]
MSNAETPAENEGGTTATPKADAAGALADLPNRVRVHVLAKLLGTSSREVLAKLGELGETARSAQSSVTRDVAVRVGEALGITQQPDADAASAAEQQPQPEANPPERSEAREEPKPAAVKTTEPGGKEAATRQPEPEVTEPARTRRPVHQPVFAAPSPVFLPPESAAGEQEAKGERPEKGGKTERPDKTEKADKTDKSQKRDKVREDRTRDDKSREDEAEADEQRDQDGEGADSADGDAGGRRRRRRGRRGRGRGKGGDEAHGDEQPDQDGADRVGSAEGKQEQQEQGSGGSEGVDEQDTDDQDTDSASKRRRRRRRRKGGDDDGADGSSVDDPPNTVVHVRDAKSEGKPDGKGNESRDGVRSVRGSTRLEAKRQRRRDGREAGRRRAPILSEAEFLARREAVERTMVVAERGESTQIGVLEDGVLVEHFVTTSGSGSIVGNVYLGRVQNVLPSMEAAFIDIGRGRNAVLYAGEVDWDAAGLEGKARKIEQALSTGDNVLVQVTKDPVGHKGARLTTQISLPGRFLVYVPAGGATGISRKLPENERRRLKDILKRIVPEDAGVIIRTASEGISEDELGRDVRRLKAQWEVIKEKADSSTGTGKKSSQPVLLYEEPDLLVKVVRDLFTEDFAKLEVQGGTAWETINAYVQHVAPDLTDRLKRHVGNGDVFTEHRVDEQLTKALDRKVWLPSGGYLVIDRTEAMTVIDVNTGKFTGSGGNLEETVTRNNLESAEEIVRQLRLRDIGGIIVIDFIDMVLESNRELVLRRLTECLGRDRTRHQVAEVTSLGLVQMTRKRVGTGLLEAFSATCEHCKGRGVIVSTEPQRGNGNGHQHGGGGGNQGGSRRSRNKGKPEEQEQAKQQDSTSGGPTPEQRESVVTAVQAMANASKAAATKGEDGEQEPVARPLNGHAHQVSEVAEEPVPVKSGRIRPRKATRAEKAAEQAASQSDSADVEPEPAVAESAPAVSEAEPVKTAPVEEQPSAAVTPAEPVAEQHGEQQEQQQPKRPSGRRPRRAASRPAGPPVHLQENS